MAVKKAATAKTYVAQVTLDNVMIMVPVAGTDLQTALDNSAKVKVDEIIPDTSELIDYELRISGVLERG